MDTDTLVASVLASAEFSELIRSVMTELKRLGETHKFEDDVRSALQQSVRDGRLSLAVAEIPSELQKKKKRAEVKSEVEKRLGNFSGIEKRISGIVDSSYMREQVEKLVRQVVEQSAAQKKRKIEEEGAPKVTE